MSDEILQYICSHMAERSIATGHAGTSEEAVDTLLVAYDEQRRRAELAEATAAAANVRAEKAEAKLQRLVGWRWREWGSDFCVDTARRLVGFVLSGEDHRRPRGWR